MLLAMWDTDHNGKHEAMFDKGPDKNVGKLSLIQTHLGTYFLKMSTGSVSNWWTENQSCIILFVALTLESWEESELAVVKCITFI